MALVIICFKRNEESNFSGGKNSVNSENFIKEAQIKKEKSISSDEDKFTNLIISDKDNLLHIENEKSFKLVIREFIAKPLRIFHSKKNPKEKA